MDIEVAHEHTVYRYVRNMRNEVHSEKPSLTNVKSIYGIGEKISNIHVEKGEFNKSDMLAVFNEKFAENYREMLTFIIEN